MAERLQILVGKLDKCAKEGSDEDVSRCLRNLKNALDKVPDELKRDDSGAELHPSVIDLIEEVEDVIDSYSLLMADQKCGKTASSKIELMQISAKMRQFLYKELQILSKITVLLQDMTSYFPDLLNKFSEKVCNEFEKLKMDLNENSKQPGSEAEQMDKRVEVSKKSAEPNRGKNHTRSEKSSRQQKAKFPQSETSKSALSWGRENTRVDIKKLPSERNSITVKLYDDEWCEEIQRLVGREKELNKLIKFFRTQKKSHSLAAAVTGVAGIGKTSLVEAVYKKVKRHFRCYAWVDMFGKPPLDAVRDTLTLLSKKQPVYSPPCNASEGSLRKTLSSFLTEKKFLLVLDDISSEADWASFKMALPQNNCNGKVVMTSRSRLDFSGCKNIKLDPLNADQSYSLLFTEEESSKRNSAKKSTAEQISELCECNPLAITIIRSMLSMMEPLALLEKLRNVRSISKKQTGDILGNVISLCYSTLQPMPKCCFLYGALFPPRSKILCRKLIRLWIAEGFIDEKNDVTMEKKGELQLQELLDRNMFQMAKMGIDEKPKFCRMLRPLQEFANKRAQLDRFCSTSDIGTSLPTEEIRSLRLSLTARECNSNTNIDKTYQSQLRSFLLLKGENLQASQMEYFSLSRFKLLTVLDLEGVPIKNLPDSVGNLRLLHYLGLRRTQLIELPRSIRRLIRLETLDIRDTFMRALPQDLEQLNKLRHLLLASSFDDNVVNVPTDIASFKDLQTLAGVKLTEKIGKNLMELKQLQKLSVGKVKNNLIDQLASSIDKMESLRSLTIKCDLGEQIHARSFKSLQEIRTLRIEGEILDMLGWIKNLNSLTHLDLRDCVLKHDPFVALANMSNLVCLSVQNAYVGKSIRFHKDCFPSLKKLSISHFQALSEWQIDGGLKNLEKLIIGSCPNLTHLPEYFSKLNNFRVMLVIKMPEAFVKEAKKIEDPKEAKQGGKEIKKLSVVVLHGLSEAQSCPTTISNKRNCHKLP